MSEKTANINGNLGDYVNNKRQSKNDNFLSMFMGPPIQDVCVFLESLKENRYERKKPIPKL